MRVTLHLAGNTLQEVIHKGSICQSAYQWMTNVGAVVSMFVEKCGAHMHEPGTSKLSKITVKA